MTDANLSVGRDGNLYLAVNGGQYAMRIAPDGTQKSGSELAYHATCGIAANAQGVMAAAHAHFGHAVYFYAADFTSSGAFSDFDGSQYRSPYGIEVGAGGDFYALDITAHMVKRLNAHRQLVASYPYPATLSVVAFRVCEVTKSLYLLDYTGRLVDVGFDGTERWTQKTLIGWPGAPEWIVGGFDVDDAGTLYLIGGRDTSMQRFNAAGQPLAPLPLAMATAAPSRDGADYIMDLRVMGTQVFIKRHHPYELFQAYRLADGAQLRVVNADYARVTVSYPADVWTAGTTLPLSITLQSGTRTLTPHWRVWLRPFNTPAYTELPWVNGQITVPADAGGLYQLKMSPGIDGGDADYQVQGIVEIRQPGTRGSATVLTPRNRLYYGRGETIPVTVKLRADGALPTTVTVRLQSGTQVLATGRMPVEAGKDPTFSVPASLTRALLPGSYRLSVQADGLTGVAQPLILGPGMPAATPFFRMNYGDYDGARCRRGCWIRRKSSHGTWSARKSWGSILW